MNINWWEEVTPYYIVWVSQFTADFPIEVYAKAVAKLRLRGKRYQDIPELLKEHRTMSRLQLEKDIPPTTKGELAERIYPGETYDFALPQSFINEALDHFNYDPRRWFVWLYRKNSFAGGEPAPLSIEASSWLKYYNSVKRQTAL